MKKEKRKKNKKEMNSDKTKQLRKWTPNEHQIKEKKKKKEMNSNKTKQLRKAPNELLTLKRALLVNSLKEKS